LESGIRQLLKKYKIIWKKKIKKKNY
jgi:hypothetical protein